MTRQARTWMDTYLLVLVISPILTRIHPRLVLTLAHIVSTGEPGTGSNEDVAVGSPSCLDVLRDGSQAGWKIEE